MTLTGIITLSVVGGLTLLIGIIYLIMKSKASKYAEANDIDLKSVEKKAFNDRWKSNKNKKASKPMEVDNQNIKTKEDK